MYIIGFNGPPYSGKDTLARMVAEHMDSQGVLLPVIEASLSTPLRRLAYQMVGETYVDDHADYSEFKETHYDEFGCTGRQLMIDVSERFLKLCYGKSIMAKMLFSSLPVGFAGVVLVRDSGFQCEIDPLVDTVGRRNLFIVQMRRATCSFEGDSREWVTHNFMQEVHNNGTLDDLRRDAISVYDNVVNQLGWKL
jgi:hypothetical protein